MKIKEFELDRAVKLVPYVGKSNVIIEMEDSARVEVINCPPTVHRGPRKVVLAATENAELSRSPMGQNMSIKICLPAECATLSAYMRELALLFEVHNLNVEISL